MFNKIKAFFKQVSIIDKKKSLHDLLDYGDESILRFETIPTVVFDFIRKVNPNLISGYSVRQLMEMRIEVGHKCFGTLLSSIVELNTLLAHQDIDSVVGLVKERFNHTHQIYLDDYFVQSDNYAVELSTVLPELFRQLEIQRTLFEQQENSLYARLLSRVYVDVHTLLVRLTEDLES